ncbi:hypothetical protein JCM10213_007662 [Rhodosporidiobolus nylandii]
MLPDHLQLATLLNSPTTRSAALAKLSSDPSSVGATASELVRPVLPYLTLPTLLHLRGTSDFEDLNLTGPQLSALIDFQRDFVVSKECPAELRDSYLVRVFPEEGGEAWKEVKDKMDPVAAELTREVKKGMVLEAKQEDMAGGKVCAGLHEFQEGLKKLSGGLLEKLDWSNVVLGGGSVLSLLTGKQKGYEDSDLDLFLYGLQPDELVPKVASIIEQIKAALPPVKRTQSKYDFETGTYKTVEVASDDEDWINDRYFSWSEQHEGELLIIKGFNAITLVPPRSHKGQRRIIQIVLVSNQTIFDALAPFDLDACCVGWTGKQVIALPRAARSLALGGWTAGVNLLDIKLARKLDPTSATVSSRSLKYLTRGFSLALPQPAIDILEAEGVDLPAAIKAGADKAAQKAEREKTKTEDLAGLQGMMRRAYNKANGIGRREAQGADYGPQMTSLLKTVGPQELRWENGEISHEYWEWQIKLAGLVHDLIEKDKADMSKGKDAKAINISTYETAYVPSFDEKHVLGLKSPDETNETYAWSKITHLQYIVKVPRALLQHAERADAKMRALISGSASSEAPPSPSKRLRSAQETSGPTFTAAEGENIKKALDLVSSVAPAEATKPNDDLYPSAISNLVRFVPPTFPQPYTSERRSYGIFGWGGLGSSKKAKKDEQKDAAPESKSLLSPIASFDSKEVAVTKSTVSSVWRVATLGGLWMFKGLDEDIDRVRDAVWQGHVATARAACTLPSGIPLWLLGTPKNPYPSPDDDLDIAAILATKKGAEQDALLRYIDQPLVSEVLAKMKSELGKLEKLVQRKNGGGMKEPGVWDDERRRFLLSWVKGEEMV